MSSNQPPSEQPAENQSQPSTPNKPNPQPIGSPPPYTVVPPPGSQMPPRAPYPITPQYGQQPGGYYQPNYQQQYYQPAYIPPPQSPKEYALRPKNPGEHYQPVAPRRGSLVQAWFSISHNLSMENIGGWASSATASWVITSIAVIFAMYILIAGALYIVGNNVILPMIPAIYQSTDISTGSTFQLNIHLMVSSTINLVVILLPVSSLLYLPVLSFGLAVFMPQHLGTLGVRFRRVIKPLSLTYVPIAIVGVAFGAISLSILIALYLQHPLTSNSTISDFNTYSLIANAISFPISVLLGVYQAMGVIQSGSIGSSLNRWATFGVIVLTGFVFGLIVDLAILPAYFSTFFQAFQISNP